MQVLFCLFFLHFGSSLSLPKHQFTQEESLHPIVHISNIPTPLYSEVEDYSESYPANNPITPDPLTIEGLQRAEIDYELDLQDEVVLLSLFTVPSLPFYYKIIYI